MNPLVQDFNWRSNAYRWGLTWLAGTSHRPQIHGRPCLDTGLQGLLLLQKMLCWQD